MDGRMKKYRQATSPDRTIVWTEPSPKHQYQQNRKVPVVYYLCRNRHLEHPHFIEVSLSSTEGLYLRDVINRLNNLRGRGMASLYSWSCKRSYKSGFVWHDLCEDDLILPAHGNEYVLKGSELLEESHSDRILPSNVGKLHNSKKLHEIEYVRGQEASSSRVPNMVGKDIDKSSQEDELSPRLEPPSSSSTSPDSGIGKNHSACDTMSLTEYKIFKGDCAADAATQTEEHIEAKALETCTRGVSTDDRSSELECNENQPSEIQHEIENSEICREEISPPPASSSNSSSGRKTDTLESLIRADAKKMNSFRILEGEELREPSNTKLKASDLIMQLISCGSIGVKDHSFGLIPTYKPKFIHSKFPSPLFSNSVVLGGEFDSLSDNPRLMSMRMEDKEYFSGSLIEIKSKEEGEGIAGLKRSSSYNADRSCNTSDSTGNKEETDAARSKCILRSIKTSLTKQPKSESMRSPISDKPRKVEIMRSHISLNSRKGDVMRSPISEKPRKGEVTRSPLSEKPRKGEVLRSPISDKPRKGDLTRSPISEKPRKSSTEAECSKPTSMTASTDNTSSIVQPSSGKRPSRRLDSFREDRVIQIEERLSSGARVIIQSNAPCEDSEGSSS
ncbi:protein UPSTREAM OF FLC-like [Papaver somniferum]|uniref:protein UPSTREAM OF FLC-like n=1 Tax=Papaver somniferum TaxID=3469 RepID=UPI000E6F5480|nr:protein UPSTREAM OF FLC-like [Papaver somniferum]XP_026415701.1 protein UPSTREAM OF FLC-like [Papaver somniferum]